MCIGKEQSSLRAPQLINRLSACFKSGPFLAVYRHILQHMIKQQLLFTLRRFSRHKLTTTINVFGLTFGILSCLVIYLYVSFEFSYDRFHKDSNRICRVMVQFTEASGMQHGGPGLWPLFAADLRGETTGFSAITSLYTDDARVLVREPGKPDRIIPKIGEDEQSHITFADSAYMDFFRYQWLAGNPASALQKPFSVVLTESEARLYFQHGQPADWIGRSLVYHDSLTVSVTGIVKDWKQNSDFGFKDLISYNYVFFPFRRRRPENSFDGRTFYRDLQFDRQEIFRQRKPFGKDLIPERGNALQSDRRIQRCTAEFTS